MREKKGKILLICLMFFVFLDLGWANSGQETPSIKKSNLIALIQEPMQKLLTQAYETIYSNIQNILHNGVAYTIILIIIIYWLILRLKTGYPTRDEIFEALKWLVMVFFVFGIFTSFNAYTGFLSLIYLPANWVKGAVAGMFDINQYGTFEDMVYGAIDGLNNLAIQLWNIGIKENNSMGTPEVFAKIATAFSLFFFFLYYITIFILVIGVSIIIIASQFITLLLLAVAPILIPFLIIKPLKPYFYSWLKLVISYSLYPSIALIVLMLAMTPIYNVVNNKLGNSIDYMYDNTFITFIPTTAFAILCIYLLTKIPNWVSQIMGVQGLDSGGVSNGFALAKGAGTMLATGGLGSVAGAAAGYLSGGGIKGALSQGLKSGFSATASQAPGAKLAKEGMRKFNSMFRSARNHQSNEYGEATP